MVKKIIPLVVIFSLALWASLPLLHPGLPPTHDGEYHIIRFYEFYKVLADGNIYPRWAPNLYFGFGVPLFNYVYPLPNYVGAMLHMVGFSFIDSFKLNMFLASILGALFFYLWVKKFWGVWGGVTSAVFYTYSPYHFVDIYVRGSVGEVWALALFPLFLWSITTIFEQKKYGYIPLAGISLGLIIFSHNIVALMFFIFSLTYLGLYIVMKRKQEFILISFVIVITALLFSAIFWLPALWETSYVKGLQIYNIKENFAQLYELIIPSWGSGFSNDDLGTKMSLQIGLANILGVVLSIVSLGMLVKRKQYETSAVIFFFLLWFGFVCFLMLPQSLSIWEQLPLMHYFQFPWRFLSLGILFASFLSGSFVFLFQNQKRLHILIAVMLMVFSVSLSIGYTKPAYYHMRDDAYYTQRSNFIDGTNSPGNMFNTKWNTGTPKKRQKKLEIIQGRATIETHRISTYAYKFTVKNPEKAQLVVNTSYFPGWEVLENEKKITTIITKEGQFSFVLLPGNHVIKIVFNDTMIRWVGKILFVFSVFLLVAITFIYRKSYYENRH